MNTQKMNIERELTALQWAKEGYILNPNAVGEEKWTNCNHVKKAVYYTGTEVHEDRAAASAIIKAKRKEYNKAAREKEKQYQEAMAFREVMKTEWQWLQEGRIPNTDARWRCGEDLNRIHKLYYSYGSSYYYCHIDDTHLPKDNEELQKAIEEYQKL